MNPSVTPTACQLPLTREPCGQCPLTISHGSFLRFVTSLTRPVSLLRCMVGYRQPPASTIPSANRNCTARWLPQSPAVTAPSRRELWGLCLATLDFLRMRSACCESLSHGCAVPAPFGKGAFGCGIGTAQTMNPGKHMLSGGGFTGSGRLKFQESGFSSGLRPHHRRKG